MKLKAEPIPGDLFLKFLRVEGVDEIGVKAFGRAAATASPEDGEKPVFAPRGDSFAETVPDTAGPEGNRSSEISAKERLVKYRQMVLNCQKCKDLARTRKTVVFGSGNVRARLMFVGEAPGHDEDVQGLPFVGKAGQLLTKIIESIGLERKQVFIANVLKCRPPEIGRAHV